MIERDSYDTEFLSLCEQWVTRSGLWDRFLEELSGLTMAKVMILDHQVKVRWGAMGRDLGIPIPFDLLHSAKSVDEIAEYLDTEYAIKRVCDQ